MADESTKRESQPKPNRRGTNPKSIANLKCGKGIGGRKKGRIAFSTLINRRLDDRPQDAKAILANVFKVANDTEHKHWWDAVQFIAKARDMGSPRDPDAPVLLPQDFDAPVAPSTPVTASGSITGKFTFTMGEKDVNAGGE